MVRVEGSLAVSWEKIAPGANVSNAVILKPVYFGFINYTAARVTYLASEDAQEARVGYSTVVGDGYVYR